MTELIETSPPAPSPSFDKLPSGLSLRVEDRTVSEVEP